MDYLDRQPKLPVAAFKPAKVPLPAGARATEALLQYTPQLSLAERDRGWDRVRKYSARLGPTGAWAARPGS